MTKTVIILTAIALFVNSCGQAAGKQTNIEFCQKEKHETSEIDSKNNYTTSTQKYLIKENGVDIFLIGQKMPNQTGSYVITKNIETRTEEGEDFEMLVCTVWENEQEILNIEPHYYDAENITDRIDNIFILSDKFKTAENIGLHSTLEEFIAAYPDCLIWYSYVSEIYVIQTAKLKGVQFFLDGNDFINEGGPSFENDMTILKPSEFKKGSKIKKNTDMGLIKNEIFSPQSSAIKKAPDFSDAFLYMLKSLSKYRTILLRIGKRLLNFWVYLKK